jgi:hypothetical protein
MMQIAKIRAALSAKFTPAKPAAKTETKVRFRIPKNFDFDQACARASRYEPFSGVLCFALPKSLVTGLRAAAKEAIARYGLHGWLDNRGWQPGDYESLSLTYNPDLRDPAIKNVHQSTLGSSAVMPEEFYDDTTHLSQRGRKFQRLSDTADTYFDTYGFRLLTPAAKISALGKFFSECSLSPVRSRLSVLYGDRGDQIGFNFGWHRDEPVFENLRINIPLVAHPNYRLQIEHAGNLPSEDSPNMSLHYLKTGYAYTFDTNRPHRVFPYRPCRIMRVHLVLGFSPWFRYDASDDTWTPNEYYGRVHPFDIVRQGGLHPALKAAAGAGERFLRATTLT